jgi:capsular polysaccharide biosynthesis protein
MTLRKTITSLRDTSDGPSILLALWRYRMALVTAVMIALALTYLLSGRLSPTYAAETRLFLSPTQEFTLDAGGWPGDPERFLANRAALAMSGPVLARAADTLGGDWDIDTLSELVDARASTTIDVITISAEAGTAEDAAAVADAVAAAYRDTVVEQVTAQVESAEELAGENPQGVRTRAAVYGDGVAAVEAADVPDRPASPQPLRDAVVAGLLVAVIGAAIALLRYERSEITSTPVEVLDAPSLEPALGGVAEYDALALTLLARTRRGGGTVGVAAEWDTGSATVVAAELAAALARHHGRATLVLTAEDAAQLPSEVGPPRQLVALQAHGPRVEPDSLPLWSVGGDAAVRVLVLPDLSSAGLRQATKALQAAEEHVVIAVGCPGEDADALAAMAEVDEVVVVASDDATSQELHDIRERVELAGTTLTCVVSVSRGPRDR